MFSKLYAKFHRIVLMRIYSDSTVLLLELQNRVAVSSPAEIKAVSPQNVEDALAFESPAQVRKFKTFLQNGHRGYYAYLNNTCVHRSWLMEGPAKAQLHKFYSFDLASREVFIEYCETAPQARGKNIFTHVLAYIGTQYPEHRVLIGVDADNTSSIRSMQKAGFVETDRKRIRIILGIRKVI